jgi:hypothetical protein
MLSVFWRSNSGGTLLAVTETGAEMCRGVTERNQPHSCWPADRSSFKY